MFLLELLVFTKWLDIRLEPKGDLYPSIRNSTQAHDLCSQTAASRLCVSELCWLPWPLPPTSPEPPATQVADKSLPSTTRGWTSKAIQLPPRKAVQQINVFPLRVKVGTRWYETIHYIKECQSTQLHSVGQMLPLSFRVGSIPASCQWSLIELEICVSLIE